MEELKLPNLQHGEGHMDIVQRKNKEYVRFSKSIEGKRVVVYANTVSNVRKKMREREREILRGVEKRKKKSFLLASDMIEWHEAMNLHRLKKRSWDRVLSTIQNQIADYQIGKMQVQSIDDRDIQGHINNLIDLGYSYSIVKKTYEALNQYFSYIYFDDPGKNPMRKVEKPTKNGMQVKEKEIEFFDEDTGDLQKFLKEANRTFSNGAYVYRYGPLLCSLIFSLMRIGEALALRWADIDFDKKVIRIRQAASRVIDEGSEPKEGAKFAYKTEFTTPKYDSIRNVPLSPNCKRYLEAYKARVNPCSENEFVFSTKKGTLVSERNLRRCLNNIQAAAGMTVQNSGFHVLRHTGITLYARKDVPETTIARMAGQKDLEMIHRIYLHVTELDMKKAAEKVDLPDFY